MGVASGSGWNLWVWLLGVVVRRYIDFLILLIPTLVSVLFCSSRSKKSLFRPSSFSSFFSRPSAVVAYLLTLVYM